MKKAWFILPTIAYSILDNDDHEIMIAWLHKVYFVQFTVKRKHKQSKIK